MHGTMRYDIHHAIKKDLNLLNWSKYGGYTVWQMAMSHPKWFAAIIPICGGGMYWNASRLKNMKVWAFHGSNDPVVYCEESKKMVVRMRVFGVQFHSCILYLHEVPSKSLITLFF